MHRPRKSDPQELDDTLNPSDRFDADHGVGKDPELSGPREDEATVVPGGEEKRKHQPRHRKEM